MKNILSTLFFVGAIGLGADAQMGDVLSRTTIEAKFDFLIASNAKTA